MKSPSPLGRRVLVYLGLAQGPETASPLSRETANRLVVISGLGLLLVVSGGVLLFAEQSPLWSPSLVLEQSFSSQAVVWRSGLDAVSAAPGLPETSGDPRCGRQWRGKT